MRVVGGSVPSPVTFLTWNLPGCPAPLGVKASRGHRHTACWRERSPRARAPPGPTQACSGRAGSPRAPSPGLHIAQVSPTSGQWLWSEEGVPGPGLVAPGCLRFQGSLKRTPATAKLTSTGPGLGAAPRAQARGSSCGAWRPELSSDGGLHKPGPGQVGGWGPWQSCTGSPERQSP